ncbi:MAG: alpha-glucosidase C-terminal domain-containing protein, partial [Devosia sp.]
HDALIDGDMEFIPASEPLLAFRRSKDQESLVCLFNLSPDPLKLTVQGDAEMVLSEAASRERDQLTLGPNGFAYLWEAPDRPRLTVSFKRRSKPRAVGR